MLVVIYQMVEVPDAINSVDDDHNRYCL